MGHYYKCPPRPSISKPDAISRLDRTSWGAKVFGKISQKCRKSQQRRRNICATSDRGQSRVAHSPPSFDLRGRPRSWELMGVQRILGPSEISPPPLQLLDRVFFCRVIGGQVSGWPREIYLKIGDRKARDLASELALWWSRITVLMDNSRYLGNGWSRVNICKCVNLKEGMRFHFCNDIFFYHMDFCGRINFRIVYIIL